MNQTIPLHILNGQVMYDYFEKTRYLEGERMIPFNEAMCYGETCKDVFSDEFSKIRTDVHQVTREQYAEITEKPLQPLLNGNFTKLHLWFDTDMFCQINLLTLLAWLDQTDYTEAVELHIVEERFQPVEHYRVKADGYHELYQQVLIGKNMPDFIDLAPLQKGIKLYLDYRDPDSDLMRYIQDHKHLSEDELVSSLLENFKDYGLGDTQYYELIKTCKGYRPKEE
ncbi:AraC family transcriptional regulator [Pseudalkalibacillus sp. R45]|uniref:AraC family transcriptional regulator n=1 Tax=Pseudalkalibacillus sp. R45 TaxID=3457433 RepID=UPI003FCD94E0